MKSREYSGLARSNWPSNRYNRCVHAVQTRIITAALGDVRGKRVLDVGCGTGRLSQHLAERGALVTGWDFSETALGVAKRETESRGLCVGFERVDVTRPNLASAPQKFDAIVTLGCLTLACSEGRTFERALGNLVACLSPRGRLLFMEPIHESRLLARLLRMSRTEWVRRCRKAGLELHSGGPLLFAPARIALAFRELPAAVVEPLFFIGERLLNSSPCLGSLGDYHWLLFERADSRAADGAHAPRNPACGSN